MEKVRKCSAPDYLALAEIWERSVRATHSFLGEEDIQDIRQALVPDYFPNVELYAIENNGTPAGFIGLSTDTIEMLFIDAPYLHHGFGSILIDFALSRGMTKVDVNEQNPSALRFYLSKGFHIVGRDETDEAGRPFPILHLSIFSTKYRNCFIRQDQSKCKSQNKFPAS